MKHSTDQPIRRKEFIELMTGIIGGLGIPSGLTTFALAEEGVREPDMSLDDSYLVKGLTGMARAKGWFDAHWGAGILAGYYLCRENALGRETTTAIKRQMDTVINTHASQFVPLATERTDEALIEDVPKALRPAIDGGLRSHGHAVIFASLTTKALRDVPQMAQPTLIERLCGLSRQIAKNTPQVSLDPTFVFANSEAMIEETLDSLLRFKGLLGRTSVTRPNFTHMVTHTEALLNFEMMGYHELAQSGHAGLKTHVSASVPALDASEAAEQETATLKKVMGAEFWNDNTNRDRWRRKWSITNNPNGDWIAAGHLFKVLYSYHRLIARVPNKSEIELCSAILLERYVNPKVKGG